MIGHAVIFGVGGSRRWRESGMWPTVRQTQKGNCRSLAFIRRLLMLSLIATFAGTAVAGDVNLAWDASSASNIGGYKVYYGTAPRQYTSPTNVGNVTTYRLTGLDPGTYYIAITAYDASGVEGPYSSELVAVVLAA